MQLDEVLSTLRALPEKERAAAVSVARRGNTNYRWVPNVGPQTIAYFCPADILGYGGQGGGGKSQLLLGLAFNEHRRSLIMRRKYADLAKLTTDAIKINGSRDGFSASPRPKLLSNDDRLIEFGAAANLGDEESWQGQDHDLFGADEATQFLERQIRFLLGWVRTEIVGQRTRVVLATNPPLTSEGLWFIGMFRPWLDLTHPKPALPGELRWFVTDPDGKDFEVDGPEPHQFPGQPRPMIPKSRTFIPAKLDDNPFYVRTGYQSTLDALPEPLRSAVRDGKFESALADADFQVIPTAWIVAAQRRWQPIPPKGIAMTALAVDVAQGGTAETVLAPRYGLWFAPLIVKPGHETPDGGAIAILVIQIRRDGCPVVIDMGGGYGGGAKLRLGDNDIVVTPYNGGASVTETSHDGAKLTFFNKRAWSAWRMREALDPQQNGGSEVCLPDDAELRADLASYRFDPKYMERRIVKIEDKAEVVKRLGRSPDKGDAVLMSLAEGGAAVRRAIFGGGGKLPTVNLGHSNMKRRR